MIDNRPALVIGYGNTLRSDDSVGPRAAVVVQGWGLPEVSTCAVAQLTPELAEPLSRVRLAIFVDARHSTEGESSGVEVRPIEPSETASTLGHVSDPGYLLALAQAVYGTRPQAWLVTVPAHDLALGEGLSSQASQGLEVALRRIAELLERPGPA